jgi:hypothetical protein
MRATSGKTIAGSSGKTVAITVVVEIVLATVFEVIIAAHGQGDDIMIGRTVHRDIDSDYVTQKIELGMIGSPPPSSRIRSSPLRDRRNEGEVGKTDATLPLVSARMIYSKQGGSRRTVATAPRSSRPPSSRSSPWRSRTRHPDESSAATNSTSLHRIPATTP